MFENYGQTIALGPGIFRNFGCFPEMTFQKSFESVEDIPGPDIDGIEEGFGRGFDGFLRIYFLRAD